MKPRRWPHGIFRFKILSWLFEPLGLAPPEIQVPLFTFTVQVLRPATFKGDPMQNPSDPTITTNGLAVNGETIFRLHLSPPGPVENITWSKSGDDCGELVIEDTANELTVSVTSNGQAGVMTITAKADGIVGDGEFDLEQDFVLGFHAPPTDHLAGAVEVLRPWPPVAAADTGKGGTTDPEPVNPPAGDAGAGSASA